MKYNLIAILGPTAVGKTKLSIKLADHFNGEIISADSRQVYKHMDIGTGKDLNDYIIDDRKIINYHLIDIIEPEGEFNLFLFKEYFKKAHSEITKKGTLPFLTGGTGLYLSSVIENYNLEKVAFDSNKYNKYLSLPHSELKERLMKLRPEMHNTTDLLDKERTITAIIIDESEANKSKTSKELRINSFNVGIKIEHDKLKKRITKRLRERLNNGMVEEVEYLISSGITFDKLNFFGLEYKFLGQYLEGKLNYNDMFQKLNAAIHNFAKRQMTWFRKMEKNGVKIHWIENDQYKTAAKLINENYLNGKPS